MTVRTTTEGHIGTLIFDNPARRNALSQRDWQAVPGAVHQLVEAGVRAIIVRGAGTDFCAGADISEFDTVRRDADTARFYEAANVEAFAAIRNAPVPTIAAINGFCLGGGFGLAAACDLRLAASGAQFAVPAARLGLAYPLDAMADIANAIGQQNAKRLLFTADRLGADEMQAMGFLMAVTGPEDLHTDARNLADRIAALAPLTHRATKLTLAHLAGGDRAAAEAAGDATFESEDYAEGRAAFRERRPAQFTGR